jgi:hypothetical protein
MELLQRPNQRKLGGTGIELEQISTRDKLITIIYWIKEQIPTQKLVTILV